MDQDHKSLPRIASFKPKFAVPAVVKRRRGFIAVIIVILIAAAAGFGGGWLGQNARATNSLTGNSAAQTRQIVTSESNLIALIAKTVGPSVVSVDVTTQGVQQDFFGYQSPTQQQGAGTGIILTADGIIITNRHVVPAGTTQVSVTLSDGTQLDNVDVLGRTNDSDPLDVAFLKIKDTKGKKLTPAVVGDSSAMQVGDRVVAIGNALGQFQNTVTSGIISGFGRSVQAGDESGASSETLQNLFQTDAAINEGNSGGPLVNASSEVIGINTAIAGGTAQNIGFAIPINDIKGLIASVEKNGKLQRPYLGVHYVSLTDDVAYTYNLKVTRGAYIAPSQGQSAIISGSPADKAGIKEKDIIIAINDQKIDENNSLTSVLGRYQVGDTVKVTVNRDGKDQTISVKLEAAPTQ